MCNRLILLALMANLFTIPSIQANDSTESNNVKMNWKTVFFDDFDRFNDEYWQDQILWVNNEDQCYVRDGAHNTREVSDGTLKLRVVDLAKKVACDNVDKHGKKHPDTQYVAGRLASKNRKEFVGGRWTARIKVHDNGQDGMFPAWWLLGAMNNEPPVQEPDETVCWPLVGSGEVDIFEHYGAGGANHYAVRVIKSEGECDKGDWLNPQKVIDADLGQWHEYSAEWNGADIVFRMDGKEVHRNIGYAKDLPEPFFAILNFAKINDAPMTKGDWVMEVDWVKHEKAQ